MAIQMLGLKPGLSNNNDMDFSGCAKKVALEAGEILMKHWGKLQNVQSKEFYWDLVTEADTASEKFIIQTLSSLFPDHSILAEEGGEAKIGNGDYTWVVDPLDGTTNFSHNFPVFAVSIALLKDRKPIIGVVYNPYHQELFMAEKDKGATLNGNSIHVSEVSELRQSLLATGFAYDRAENPNNNYKEFCYLTNNSQGVRRLGSAALDLAYVAAGRLDGYWEHGLQPWDIAAGALIVEEAGGLVTGYHNKPVDIFTGQIIATNGKIHNDLNKSLQ